MYSDFDGKGKKYLDAGCWILDAGCWMLDAGCWMLDAGCWMLDAGDQLPLSFFQREGVGG
jgi:hypothetical protein